MTKEAKAIDLLVKAKKYKKAIIKLSRINGSPQQRTHKTVFLEAECLCLTNQYKKAILKLEFAFNLGERKEERTHTLQVMAKTYVKLGKVNDAINALIESTKIDQSLSNVSTKLLLSQIALESNRLEIVEDVAPSLLCLTEYANTAQFLLCQSAIKSQNKQLAISRLNKLAFEITSLSSAQFSFVIHSLVQLAELEKADKLLVENHSRFKQETWFQLLKGIVLFEQRNFKEAKICLIRLRHENLPNWFSESPILYQTLARTLEELNEYPKAFENFEIMSKLTKEKYGNYKPVDILKTWRTKLNRLPMFEFNSHRKEPVFMLGFPRSGTTLLETALDTHPNIDSLSERHTLTRLIEVLTDGHTINYAKKLINLSKLKAEGLRESYFQYVDEITGNSTNTIVDKMPIYSIHLPLIKTLFPESKIILSIRHPIDVILSNFQQYYAFNNEMAFLTSLEDCLSRYVDVFDFINSCQNSLSIEMKTIRYEDLVTNMQKEMHLLYKFIGVTKDDSFKNFHANAKNKVVNTSSRNQVSRPLYESSKYKWLNYSEQMAPYIEKLDTFVDQYGYK